MGKINISNTSNGGGNVELYPIGSVYFSTVNTNPSTYFGGTWELIGTKLAILDNDGTVPVYGNGKALGMGILTGIQKLGSLVADSSGYIAGVSDGSTHPVYLDKGATYSSPTTSYKLQKCGIGISTKSDLGDDLGNSGLIAEVGTETIYSFKRIA